MNPMITEMPNVPQGTVEAYRAVYAKLPQEKADVVRQVCDMFMLAHESYLIDEGIVSPKGASGMQVCGSFAESYRVKFAFVRERLGMTEEATLAKIEDISKWLETKNWITLPVYVNRNGETVRTTAQGVHQFMNRNYERIVEYRRQMKDCANQNDKRKLERVRNAA